MFQRTRHGWVPRLAAFALFLALLAGCGSGHHGPVGFLEVAANAQFFGDYIYRIDVFYDLGGLASSDNVIVDDGFTVSLGAYPDGVYDLDVYWSDGVFFPVSIESINNVDVFAGLTTTVQSFEP